MVQAKQERWRLRKEIHLGTLLQGATMLVLIMVGWANLQSELAIIRHDLERLLQTSATVQSRVDALREKMLQQEMRLARLEEEKQ